MAVNNLNPGAASLQPDPVLTNVMQDNSKLGGWMQDILASVKQVPKDWVRWGKQDSQKLMEAGLDETQRTPGSRANLITRGELTWFTSNITEDALRAEYLLEDIANSISPEEPRVNAARRVINGLQFAIELRVKALYASSNFAAANKAAATVAWASSGTSIQYDIENAKLTVFKRSGLAPNYILMPAEKFPGFAASSEILNLRFGKTDYENDGGYPSKLFGLKLLIPGLRNDVTPTGTFTPAFVWNGSDAIVGYSPTLSGESWNGTDQTFAMQFENQLDGAAYEAREYPDPYFNENKKFIVHGSVRRSAPEIFNPEVAFMITSI